MRDERLEKMARLLAEYCIGAGEGDQALIEGASPAVPLVKELYARLLQLGAIPIPRMDPPGTEELFFEHAKDVHYRETPPAVWALYEGADAFVTIMAPTNTRALAAVDPGKQRALAKRDEGLEEMVERKDRWVLTLFPTEARAQEARMGLAEYGEFVFAAMALGEEEPVRHWREKAREQEGLIGRMEGTREVHIRGTGTDLTLSVEDRRYVNDGRYNMPGGEIYTSPVEDSANGTVYFGLPVAVDGREVSGVRLRFENGSVVEADADRGQGYLHSVLEADAGARYLGELGLGTNYGVGRATGSTLFDEKIGGTAHLALGYSLPATGGKNRSGVHWDLICDLREGGELYADGNLIQKDGYFTDPSSG